MAYCRFCGGKISETASFCKNCGKNLAKEEPVTQTKPVSKTRSVSKTKPVTQTRPVTKTKPVSKTRSVSKTKPVTQTRPVSKTKPVTQTRPVTTKKSPELDNSKNVKSYIPEPKKSSNINILEYVKIIGDIKNTLLFYDDYLIIANIPKNAVDRVLDIYTGEVIGDMLGGFIGKKMGASYDKDKRIKLIEGFNSLTPQEILDYDPVNLLINYRDINEIKFEKKFFRLPHIIINTSVEEHKYSLAEEKYFKEIKSSIKSILKDKVTL